LETPKLAPAQAPFLEAAASRQWKVKQGFLVAVNFALLRSDRGNVFQKQELEA
jgi:hypothetical protein